jgi:predicted NBD/HSP70 family sugar kinase
MKEDPPVLSAPRATNGPDGLRSQGLSQILTTVHRSGPLSRAELTRRSGFNRSTVGSLVQSLTEKSLVLEAQPAVEGRVGRPSPIVRVNHDIAVISVNPDIDALTVGVVGLGGHLHRRIRRETRGIPSVEEAVALTHEVVGELDPVLSRLHSVLGVGIAVPGLVNPRTGRVLLAPHLGWHDTDVTVPFGEALGLPAIAANDAFLGSLAESIFGAALGVGDALYLNGSTSGIGGGVITGGSQLVGSRGYGGELGHTVVRPGGASCHCGRSGCLDAEVRLEWLLDAAGVDGGGMEALEQVLTEESGDAVMAEVDRQLELLTSALVDFTNIFDPRLIVLGGFLGVLAGSREGRLSEAVNARSLAGGVEVRRAGLGPELLLIGAAELALRPLLASPS